MAGKRASAAVQSTQTAQPQGEPLLLNKAQAAAKIGTPLRTLERLLATGEVFSVKVGARRYIPAWATVAYMRRLCEASGAVDEYGLMAG